MSTVLIVSGAVGLPSPAQAEPAVSAAGYQAVIRRTAHGVPHVLAADLGSVTFGQGYAYAEDRFCDLADQIVKVRSERSRWHGAGPENANIISDFAYKQLGVVPLARAQEARLSAEERQLLGGYVAGFNAYLAAVGRGGVPGWCRGAPWIAPISGVDLLAYQRDLALLASGRALLAPIALAEPPGAARSLSGGATMTREGLEQLEQQGASGVPGSNAWGIGADRSATGKGMLVGNPHFPWQGELKFWESHLTVPGQLNVYGVALGGLPGVQIGFTDKVAWSHTVAQGTRFTFYTVNLVPGDPTKYYFGGAVEAMTARTFSIQVKVGSALQTQTRTMYSTRYGPVLELGGTWTTDFAYTYRDANIDNDRMLQQWFNIARAPDLAGIRTAIGRDQGIPWVNIVASDTAGNTGYADPAQTPALSAASTAEWLATGGLEGGVLDGSNPANVWETRPGARSPGLVPFSQQPQLGRRDYVFNANDSHWVPNQYQFLTGYTPLQGPEGTPLSVRSRQNVRLINGREPGSLTSAGKFTVAGLGTAILSGSTFTSDELTAATVTACRARGATPVVVDGQSVDLRPGCDVLAAWDRRFETTSRGAVLWRETVFGVFAEHGHGVLNQAGPLFGVPFNPADPTNTPRGAPANMNEILEGLARGMIKIRSQGFPLNVRLDAVQYTLKGGEKIPVPGSTEDLGIANLVEFDPAPGSSLEPVLDPGTITPPSDLTRKGYVINFGTSFLFTLGYTASGPDAKCILTYGQSIDPASPFYADQTRLFSQKRLRDCKFSEASILSDPALKVRILLG